MSITNLVLNGIKVAIEDGELISLISEEHEYIHQKGSPGWGSADTEMFPIIGPVNEANFQVQTSRGNAIQDQHGLLRQFPYELVASNETSADFKKEYEAGTPIKNSKYSKKSTEEWLTWPFSFSFEKRFELKEYGLEVTFTISGEKDMPFMLGYHPAFKLHSGNPVIKTADKEMSLDEVLAVGSRALEVANCNEITLKDEKAITIKTEGFGNFMCWTEVRNMVCVEPVSFYPYALAQSKLHEGFEFLGEQAQTFKVQLFV